MCADFRINCELNCDTGPFTAPCT